MSDFVTRLLDRRQPLIVAEVAQNHDGSLGICHAYVDALAEAGADAIKFQTHIAAEESTLDEQFRVKFSYQDDTRYDYWQRMEFSEPQWLELKNHADEKGIAFLSTPFSAAAVALLERLNVPAWKVGSGDVALDELFQPMLATGKPLIVSSGMSGWPEIDRMVERLRAGGSLFALMQCTSQYPTPLDQVGLNNLSLMQHRYECRIGLSDHSGSTTPALAAIARGFPLIEVHATFDRRMFGPDVSASLTIEQIAELARFASDLRMIDDHPVDKDSKAAELGQQKTLFSRSAAPRGDLPAGHELRAEDLAPKKPGTGIAWAEKDRLVGRVLKHAVAANRLLKDEDFE